jgi:malate permease and related proteins
VSNFALLLLCFALGMVLRRTQRLPEATPAALNGFIVHVSLPALTLHHLRDLNFDASVAAPLAMAWLLFAVGVAFFFAAQRLFRWPAATTGALILTGALGNTSFVGLPMIECFFGREHVGLGILIDQLGTYVVLSTVGLLIAATLSAGELTARAVAQRIFTFPPFLAVLVALASAPLPLPPWADAVLARLGDTLAPLALLSVGFQLRLAAVHSRWRPLAAGLGYKLVAGPLAVLAVFAALYDLDNPAMQVAVFEAAMAPMIGGAIVAAQHKLDPELGTLMLGIGIPLSFLTLPVWWYALAAL